MKFVDLSMWTGALKHETMGALHNMGVEMGIVQAWGGRPDGTTGPNDYCDEQLGTFRHWGKRTGIYIWIPPDETSVETDVLIASAKRAAGIGYNYVDIVVLDVETIYPSRPLHPTGWETRLLNALVNVGDCLTAIYTNKYQWNPLMRESTLFRNVPLWDATWDGEPVLKSVDYGGWVWPAMKQYAGNVNVNGQIFDFNVANPNALRLGDIYELRAARRETQILRNTINVIRDAIKGV